MNTLQHEINQIQWWHSMDLGGVMTPGHHDPRPFVDCLSLPDLTGRSVLDVGTWDGFYAFEAERRGAKYVTATDKHIWSEWPTGRQGFDLARRVLQSNVDDVEIDPLDLTNEAINGPFDVVLCLGVLYHMRHPLLLLEKLHTVTGDLLVLETHTDCLNLSKPAMAFYEGREIGNDPTNWCGPNPACVEAMCRAAGFVSAHTVWTTQAGTVGRCVVHARKR